MLIPAVGALHNFIRIHDAGDEARDLRGNSPHREASGSSLHNFTSDPVSPREIAPEELGIQITAEERARASARRDAIAKAMWVNYVAYNATDGEE
jgi:hypothetical protein